MAAAIEVLEHVPDPEATLAEMARVARRRLLVSVPREPLWRGLNMARGAYLRALGNTPGHVNHWSKRGVRRAARRATGRSRRPARRSRGRCCSSGWMTTGRSRPRPPGTQARTAAARRSSSVGIGATGLDHLRLLLARLARAGGGRLRRHHAAVVGGVHHGLRALPAGRAAPVAHDRRPRRPRHPGHEHLRVAAHDPARARRCCSPSPRSRCAGRSRTTCSAARRPSTGS